MNAVRQSSWARRPLPRTLDDLAAIAHRGGHRLRAIVSLGHGSHGEVFFERATVLHAKVGWALGGRALARLRAAEPFGRAMVQLHATPEMITLDEPWTLHAATPRPPRSWWEHAASNRAQNRI